MKQSIEQIMNAGAKGVKIAIGGRLGGADIARTEALSNGKMPLHTLRANIDFSKATAFTTYGTIGVKVWINKGEVFESSRETAARPPVQQQQQQPARMPQAFRPAIRRTPDSRPAMPNSPQNTSAPKPSAGAQ